MSISLRSGTTDAALQYNGVDVITTDGTTTTIASAALTGVPTAPTAAVGTDTTQLATTAFVQANSMSAAQSWQNVGASRAVGTLYTNTTGRPIVVYPICSTYSTVGRTFAIFVNGIVFYSFAQNGYTGVNPSIPFVVPAGSTYQVNSNAAHGGWYELR